MAALKHTLRLPAGKSPLAVTGTVPGRIIGHTFLDADTLAWEINIDTTRGKRSGWYLTGTVPVKHSHLGQLLLAFGAPLPQTDAEAKAFNLTALHGSKCRVKARSCSLFLISADGNIPLIEMVEPAHGWSRAADGSLPGASDTPDAPARPRREVVMERLRDIEAADLSRVGSERRTELFVEARDLRAELGAMAYREASSGEAAGAAGAALPV